MSTILLHMVWTYIYLACRSEMCCTQLANNTRRKKSPKTHHLRAIAQLYQAVSLETKACIDNREKLVKQQSTYPHNMVNFGPLTAEI